MLWDNCRVNGLQLTVPSAIFCLRRGHVNSRWPSRIAWWWGKETNAFAHRSPTQTGYFSAGDLVADNGDCINEGLGKLSQQHGSVVPLCWNWHSKGSMGTWGKVSLQCVENMLFWAQWQEMLLSAVPSPRLRWRRGLRKDRAHPIYLRCDEPRGQFGEIKMCCYC